LQNGQAQGAYFCNLQKSEAQTASRLVGLCQYANFMPIYKLQMIRNSWISIRFVDLHNILYMARIAGVNLPNKRMEVALTYIYGIGRPLSSKILVQAQVDKDKRPNELTEDEINRLRNIIEKNFKVEGELKRETLSNVKRLKEIGCYRGFRHARGLPSRGQRTKTNSRTVRGNVRKTMGSGRKPTAQKT
jgi:small subunit ribosomal protein S13